MVRIGVNDRRLIEEHDDVARPESQVSPFHGVLRHRRKSIALLVTVAGTGAAAGDQGLLHQSRAIEASTGTTTPNIGSLQISQGDRRGVASVVAQRGQMAIDHIVLTVDLGETAFVTRDTDQAVSA